MPRADAFDLQRFVTAQDRIYGAARAELRAGQKRSHWMWFVFPQLRDLGRSEMATFYGIGSLEEARAYLQHPELGARLIECTHAVIEAPGPTLHDIFGSPDDLKFCSSMTLFALAAGEPDNVCYQALDRWSGGRMDQKTVDIISR